MPSRRRGLRLSARGRCKLRHSACGVGTLLELVEQVPVDAPPCLHVLAQRPVGAFCALSCRRVRLVQVRLQDVQRGAPSCPARADLGPLLVDQPAQAVEVICGGLNSSQLHELERLQEVAQLLARKAIPEWNVANRPLPRIPKCGIKRGGHCSRPPRLCGFRCGSCSCVAWLLHV